MMILMVEMIKGGLCLIKFWFIFICFLDNNWLEIWGFICFFYVCLWKFNIYFICRKVLVVCYKLIVMIFFLSIVNGFLYGFFIFMYFFVFCWGKNFVFFYVFFKKRLIKFMIVLVMLWLKCLKDIVYLLMDWLIFFFYGFIYYIFDKLLYFLKGILCVWCVGFMVLMFYYF